MSIASEDYDIDELEEKIFSKTRQMQEMAKNIDSNILEEVVGRKNPQLNGDVGTII